LRIATLNPLLSSSFLESEENMANSQNVLCVEDNADSCRLLQVVLENEGFKVVSCSTSEEGLQLAKEGNFSLIILDHRLTHISGVEICRRIRTYDKQTPIIFFTASAFPAERAAGLAAGANDYLVKPDDLGRITETVKRLVS
jgi:DNA-binding response OmpR family regulator